MSGLGRRLGLDKEARDARQLSADDLLAMFDAGAEKGDDLNLDSTLTSGDIITVTGRDRYEILAIRDNGDVDCWGGRIWRGVLITAGQRTFRPQQVRRVR